MDTHDTFTPVEPLDDELREDPTLAQDIKALAGQVRTFAEAELAYQKARASYLGSAARTIAILGVVAAVLAFFAVMAAVMGTVIALGPLLGPWGAMAVVTLVLLVIAATCGFAALSKAKRTKAVLGEGAGDAATR